MSPSVFIDDGYTIDAVLEKTKFYPEVKVKYRPIGNVEVSKVLGIIASYKNDPEKAERMAARYMAQRVVEWDATNHKGEPVEPSEQNMCRLEPHFAADLFKLLFTNDPDKTSDEAADAKNL